MRLAGCGIKSIRPIFKTEMFMYQSKANIDEKFCLVKLLINKTKKLGNAGKGACLGRRIPNTILVHYLFPISY